MTVFTLKEKFEATDPKSVLNGKVFVVKKLLPEGNVSFIDLTTKKAIWYTTGVVNVERNDYCMTINTYSGSVYELIDVRSLIPTFELKPEVAELETITTAIVPSTVDISNIEVVSENKKYKHIKYGDGFDKTEFVFNRDITEEEFIEYLKVNGYRISPFDKWYNDYSKIEGEGNKWVYTWVLVYTD